eukprot:352280-Chlamydomonas_euryale.AAC.1
MPPAGQHHTRTHPSRLPNVQVRALIDAGVARVVVGLKHPLPHARGRSVAALRRAGVTVDVLSDAMASEGVVLAGMAGGTCGMDGGAMRGCCRTRWRARAWCWRALPEVSVAWVLSCGAPVAAPSGGAQVAAAQAGSCY